MLIFKDLFTPYNRVRSEGDGGDVGLTDYRDDKNDNGSNGGVDKGCDSNGSVDEGYDVSDIDKEVVREVVKRFV